MTLPPILLASASPRRQDLLGALGLRFTAVPASIDETVHPGEDPFAAAERLARAKASNAALVASPDALVIAADTIVVLEGKALGKPSGQEEARQMLRALSGKRHDVVTGVALVRRGVLVSGRDVTEVEFAPLDEETVARYAVSGEPDDKAGGYALQGLGGLFIERIDGSPSNVVGLPVRLLYLLARRLGIDLMTGNGGKVSLA